MLDYEYTASRGRSLVPCTFLRKRRWRRSAAFGARQFRHLPILQHHPAPTLVGNFAGLAGLAPHPFAFVPNAFAQIRLRPAVFSECGLRLRPPVLCRCRARRFSRRPELRFQCLAAAPSPPDGNTRPPIPASCLASRPGSRRRGFRGCAEASVTPVTILATRLRVKPCRARCFGSSDGRVTTMLPSSTAICMSSGKVRVQSRLWRP